MTNQEQKQELWQSLLAKFSHLENYCKIDVKGLDDDNIYFHPTFIISEDVSITSQCDVGNRNIYALRVNITGHEYFAIELYEDLLDNVIIGYHTNRDVVLLALKTLSKVKKHIHNLDSYTTEYVNNILVGSSINDITKSFVNELNATNQIISFMQNKSKWQHT